MVDTKNFTACPWCGAETRVEFVRGHYECIACRRPVADCCDGETVENTHEVIHE
jgi:hypothetical protein